MKLNEIKRPKVVSNFDTVSQQFIAAVSKFFTSTQSVEYHGYEQIRGHDETANIILDLYDFIVNIIDLRETMNLESIGMLWTNNFKHIPIDSESVVTDIKFVGEMLPKLVQTFNQMLAQTGFDMNSREIASVEMFRDSVEIVEEHLTTDNLKLIYSFIRNQNET